MSTTGIKMIRRHIAPKTVLASALIVTTAVICQAAVQTLRLNQFDWTIDKVRTETSIKRQTLSSSLLTGFEVEEFKPNKGVLSVVTVRIKAKESGEVILAPEFFIASSGSFFEVCQGLRVVDPKPSFGPGAFDCPKGGNGIDTQTVTAGQSLVLEQAFLGEIKAGHQIFAASCLAKVPEAK